ncbi:hypothetical protein RSOL_450530 [Rhizoctonia solani AG-3 Rhs1AP]|uniref:Zinc-finger domain-containing protein n=1 Tax=Rhizoctonia solani AG-3 Rhs1AP TaxID=1086054 RepID=X8JR46_9AGAM|nr:hypothetical protein RSOL_450530 [Rhizoctonia solani AG-3 Rhs1AP]
MSKRRTRDEDDSLLMPPPAASSSVRVQYDSGQSLAPTRSPPPRHSSVASASRPVFGRYNSAGPRRRSALDNIGYVPEDIPTPRSIRPFSIAVSTGKRRRGLKVFDTAATSPVRPAKPPIQPAASPSKHNTPSKRSVKTDDDDEYIVDSSGDEGPVRFNLPKDAPRSSKIPRTSNTSVRRDSNPTSGLTPSTLRLGPGRTPARSKDPTLRLGTTPARPVATPHSKPTATHVNTTPIRLDLSAARPAFRPSLPTSEASPFVSSPYRPRVVPKKPKPAEGPTRIVELKEPVSAPLSTVSKRAFSSSGAKRVSSLAVVVQPPPPTPTGAGTKRAPGSKSTSPGAPGPKRPRVATPSPPAHEDVIIVSSDEEEQPEEKRPSPSPSLGEYRPTPTHSGRSRAGSGSASSDVVLLESPTGETAKQDVPRHETPREEAPARDPHRETTPEPAPPPEESPRRPSVPKDVPRLRSPPTPSPSRHSSSSSERAKASAKSVEVVESSDSLRPFRGRRIVPGRGRRKRLSQREPQSSEPESEPSPQEVEAPPSRPTDSSPSQPEPSPSEPQASPSKRPDSTETSPPKREESPPRTTYSPSPWTGKPLFRPSTTIASGLTPLRDSPGRSIRPTPGPSKLYNPEPIKSPEVDPTSLLGDDPLQSMYDSPHRPIFGPPQYFVMGPPQLPRAFPSQSPGPSTVFSYSRLSAISSIPPPTVNSSVPPAVRRIRRRMDCVLLPRASKAVRRALEREQQKKARQAGMVSSKKDKGKAKDASEYPVRASPSPSPNLGSDSETRSSSSYGPPPPPQFPAVKYLVIDPQLALRSNYDALPPEIDESPDRYCHCCRTRSGVGKLKMRCVNLSYRRRRGVAGHGPHECGLYWCQRCVAKHDMTFNPTSDSFKCPFCSGTCECDVCRRERGQEKLGRWAIKVVAAKPGKRTLDAIVKGRVASGNARAGLAGPLISVAESSSSLTDLPPESEIAGPLNLVEPSTSTEPAPEPEHEPKPESSPSTGPEPESPKTSAPALSLAPEKTTPTERGPTTWHGRHTPPPLRRHRTSAGHTLSTEAHIFIPRGPRGIDELVLEQDEDEEEDEEEPVGGDRHRAFEGDYSAVAEASLLGADSGEFEFEHGPGGLGGNVGAGSLGVEINTVDGEGEHPGAHIPIDDASRSPSEAPGGTLAYPPTESSLGSEPDEVVEIHAAPVESTTHTITGTLDDHAPAGVLAVPTASAPDDAPGEISHDALAKIFDESVQGFAESGSEHDYGPAARNPSSEVDELQSTPGIDEPRPPTPDLDEIRAALGLGDTTGHQEPTLDLGQLHPEGTFETVPRISMGGDGGLTHGSLQDISLFNAVTDCSDETRDIALSFSQTEHALIVCGSLLDQACSYPFDLERLAIPELEEFESEHEPDLVPTTTTTDPESSKSTILETPSPQLEPDSDSNLTGFRSLFDTTNESRSTPFILTTETKQDHMRKILQSHFTQQQVEPETRTTRSQARRSMMERSKFLRSKRCYGMAL